jgi:diguanylate cyclase (GGDEF)-like protein
MSVRKTTQQFRHLPTLISAVVIGLLVLIDPIQASAAENPPIRFDHLTLDDGLSQSDVLAIHQDSHGLLWIGTENGLNRYDGYEIKVYRRERGNPDALSSDFITDIDEDSDGNLWLATNGGGLVKYTRSTGLFKAFRHDENDAASIGSNAIRRVLIDESGTIWIGTRDAGLDRLDPDSGTFTHISLGTNAAVADNIYALHIDVSGALWVGGDFGLARVDRDSGDFHTFSHDAGDPAGIGAHSVRAIAEDSAGRLWIGSDGSGISRLRADQTTFEHFRNSRDDDSTIASDRVWSIYKDSRDRLWVGTTRGLNLVDHATGRATRYVNDPAEPTSLGGDFVTTIYEDRTGLLWVGTKTRGLSKWNPRTWAYGYEPAEELTVDAERKPIVTAFVEDDKGTLWVGTFGDGLNAWDRASDEIVRYRADSDLQKRIGDDRVMSLMRDRKGRIWVGTMSNGITRIDPESDDIVSFRNDPADAGSLSANGIMALFEDSSGLVWVGTFGGGISRFDPATGDFTRFGTHSGALSSSRITSFAEDRAGYIWIGTEAGGLNLYDPRSGEFTHFRHDPEDPASLAADGVYAINVADDGTVWVGTHGGGLDRVIGGAGDPAGLRFKNLSQRDGLANDVVYGIEFDDLGRLWLSTNYGISRYNPDTGEIRNLHRRDGLQSDEFNFGAHYRSASGELFFGGQYGFNSFKPEAIQAAKVVPLIALTGFFNSNDPLKADLPDDADGVELSWKDDNVSFEFAALDFTAPNQNRYMYKLEGFDEDWIDLGTRRRITYTDLGDGQYLLRVKAANSEGVWNEAGFALPVTVTPAPWDTWWAYTGYLALAIQLAVGLWFAHKRKIAREEEYSRRLEREVEARTESLVEKNEELKSLAQALQESSLSDPLTGLRNRRYVFEEMPRTLDDVRRKLEQDANDAPKDTPELVFMMIDMDQFKPINDTYGHAAGDEVLLQFRDLLMQVTRRTDVVVRWGGDEFMIIAKQDQDGDAEALAERIRASVAGHKFVLADGQIVRTTCSIGFAAFPLFKNRVDESSVDQVIALADSLMYEAKKKRDAWAGLLGPSEAATSFDFDHDRIESTSLLFRARHTGNLTRHQPHTDDDFTTPIKGAQG